MAKKMRVATNMPKDSLTRKKKALVTITQAPTEQNEETTLELVFKRKRKATRMVEPSIRTLFLQKARLHTEM